MSEDRSWLGQVLAEASRAARSLPNWARRYPDRISPRRRAELLAMAEELDRIEREDPIAAREVDGPFGGVPQGKTKP